MIRQTKKAFTLVELIVVITILAILATIAFLSFQSYSADARDSKRQSDIRNLVSGIAISSTKGTAYTDMVDQSGATNTGYLQIDTQGFTSQTSSNVSWYKVGKPNFTTIAGVSSSIRDPKGLDYVIATVATGGLSGFQIAASLENGGTKKAYVNGNFTSRKMATISTGSVNYTASAASNTISLTTNIGFFDVGDKFKTTGATATQSGVILSINGSTITYTGVLVASTSTGITLTADEAYGLIGTGSNINYSTTNVVTDGGSNLPYTY